MSDPYWANVSLLLKFEGANGTTTFDDLSSSDNTVTTFGTAQIQSDQLELDGNSDYIRVPNSTALLDASTPFTIELLTTGDTWTGWSVFFSTYPSGQDGITFYADGTQLNIWAGYGFGTAAAIAAGTLSTATEYHLAVTRNSSGEWKLWINGTQAGSTDTESNTATVGATSAWIGAENGDLYLDGRINQFRITNGSDRYTAAFTPPADFEVPETFAADTPLGAPEAVVYTPDIFIVVPTPLAVPEMVVYSPDIFISAPTPIGTPSALLAENPEVIIQIPGLLALSGPSLHVYNDFSSQLTGTESTLYVMDLLVSGSPVRVPIRSWQATLRVASTNYVQCVIPNAGEWVTQINAATEFSVYRVVTLSGVTVEQLIATCGLDPAINSAQRNYSRGGTNYSCVVLGYKDGYPDLGDNPSSAYDRTLAGIRSFYSGAGGYRVRSNIDMMLRPGYRVFADGTEFIAGYINYYANDVDSYMDVGE